MRECRAGPFVLNPTERALPVFYSKAMAQETKMAGVFATSRRSTRAERRHPRRAVNGLLNLCAKPARRNRFAQKPSHFPKEPDRIVSLGQYLERTRRGPESVTPRRSPPEPSANFAKRWRATIEGR